MNNDLDEIYRPIKRDLNRVEAFLNKELKTRDGPASRLNESILSNPGKRLRPALSLFSAYSVLEKAEESKFQKQLVNLAAAIELIHAASLVHDDVVDHSMLRRHRPTINASFSNEAAVAFGDYLYSKGLNILARLKVPEIISCVTEAALGMCEGELIQILNRSNFKLKRQVYMTIIKKKTAHLMSSSCAAAVMLIDKARKDTFLKSFSSFGLNFGIAFQIIDDCLDLVGTQANLGKSIGLDLQMGEFTLPLLLLMESKTNKDSIKRLLEEVYSDKINSRKERDIKKMLLDSGVLFKSKNIAATFMEKAKEDLEVVRNCLFKEKLMALADFTLNRLASEDISPGRGHQHKTGQDLPRN